MKEIDLNLQRIQNSNIIHQKTKIPDKNPNNQFRDILSDTIKKQNLIISNHAQKRLEMRNINLTDVEMGRINKGLELASQKGIKDSLILMDQKAFIINVKNRTMVTAFEGNQLKENVFTNIDGAVIV